MYIYRIHHKSITITQKKFKSLNQQLKNNTGFTYKDLLAHEQSNMKVELEDRNRKLQG
jgi:hypothetical protein